MKKSLGYLLVSAAVVAWLPSSGSACSCAGPLTVCEAYDAATAVFTGVVSLISDTSIKLEAGSQSLTYAGKLVRFSVEHVYKGQESAELSVETGSGGGDCGYHFEAGIRYLVYAYAATQGRLGTGICTRTNLFADASEDLDYVLGRPESKTTTRISGVVVQYTSETAKNGYQLERPISGTKVTITGKNRSFESVTSQDGSYRVIGLPPGEYRVKADLPGNLALIDETGKDYVEATIPSGGCAIANIVAEPDGRIGGKVLDGDGHPVAGVFVDLVAADTRDADG